MHHRRSEVIDRTCAVGPALDDVVVFGHDYTLASGQTIQGGLFVLGGSATVENAATVTGDVVVFGGNVSVQGQVNGSTVIFGGAFTLGSEAGNNGDAVVFGGNGEVAAPGFVGNGGRRSSHLGRKCYPG